MRAFSPTLIATMLLLTACSHDATHPVPAPAPSAPAPAAPAPAAPATSAPEPEPPVKRQDWAEGTPEAAVQTFYATYLGQRGVLHNRTYRQSKELSPQMIQYVDELLAGWEKNDTGGFDPFLCAQNTPQEVRADKAEINGTNARVLAYGGPWSGGTWNKLAVQLGQHNSQWQIERILCAAP